MDGDSEYCVAVLVLQQKGKVIKSLGDMDNRYRKKVGK